MKTTELLNISPIDTYNSNGVVTLQTLHTGAQFSVVDGPACADQFVFWQVQLMDDGQIGWVTDSPQIAVYTNQVITVSATAKNATNQHNGITLCTGTPLSFLAVGQKGIVADVEGGIVRLRSGAGTNTPLVAEMPQGTEFTVVGGPQCGSYVWWQIQLADGTNGWAAEGIGQDYFLEPKSEETTEVVDTSNPNNRDSTLVGIWMNLDSESYFSYIAFFPDGIVVPVPHEGDIRGTYTIQSNSTLLMDLTITYADAHNTSYMPNFDTANNQLVLQGDFISGTFTKIREISENDLSVCSGTVNTHLLVGFGGQISLDDGGKAYVRSDASTKANVKDEITYSPRVYVLGGPTCSEGFAWWLIQNITTGVQGWIAEGKEDNYTLEFVPIQSPIPVVEVPPRQNGTVTLFEDEILILKQLDGDLEYRTREGCTLGSTPSEYIAKPLLSEDYILQSIRGI